MNLFSRAFVTFHVSLLLASSAGLAAELGPVARMVDGRPFRFSYEMAKRRCSAMSTRLPTAREFAKLAIKRKAKGLKEPQYKGSDPVQMLAEFDEMYNKYYWPVYKLDSAGQMVVDFFFNHEGYEAPWAEIDQNEASIVDANNYIIDESSDLHSFWTSDASPEYVNQQYTFNEKIGSFVAQDIQINMATRCIKKK